MRQLNFVKIKYLTWQLDATTFAQPPEITDWLKSFTRINKNFPEAKVSFVYSPVFRCGHQFVDYINVTFSNEADEAFFQLYFSEFIS